MWLYSIGKAILYLPMRCIYRITVSGKEHVPIEKRKNREGFILASNHISAADPILLAVCMKPQIHFMAKEELFRNKFVGWVIRHLGAFAVSRGKGDTASLSKGEELVGNGKVLGIFPEGTRSKDGKLLKAKSGVILIAASTGGNILPVCLTALPKQKFARKHVHVTFGQVIENSELAVDGPKNLAHIKAASRLLMERIAALRSETLAMYGIKEQRDD